MLAEWLASLFFRGDRDRPPVRTLLSGSPDDPQREDEDADLGRSWGGTAAAGDHGTPKRPNGTLGTVASGPTQW
jgi:hypothetical protein